MSATYYAEAEALEKAYWKAVGWCLQYGIKVYEVTSTGFHMKALGDMNDEIRAHRLAEKSREERDYAEGMRRLAQWMA